MEQKIGYHLKSNNLKQKKGMKTMKNIAIIGSGSWGVALAVYLANIGNSIKIWSFSEKEKK